MSADASFLSERVAPHMIRYSNMTPLAFEGKQQLKKFYPTNQSTYSQDNNVIRIPISSGTAFLDGGNSYLSLSFTNTNARAAGNDYTFSNSAHSLIDRIRIISSSGQELENIMHYGQLHCALSDLLLSPEARMSRLQEGYGIGGAPTATVPAAAAFGDAAGIRASVASSLASLAIDPKSVGCRELTVARNTTVQIYLPLELSQLVGANKKLIPLFLTGELTLEISLAARPCMVADIADPLTYQVANVAYNASMVEFSGTVNSSLTQMVAESGLFLHGTCWSSQKLTLAANQSSFVNSERLKSVKSIFITFHDETWAAARRPTNRRTNNINSLQVKIGSEYFPPQPIRADSTAAVACGHYLNETLKAIGQYNNTDHAGMVNIYNFSDSTNNGTVVGRAVYGLDLDAFGKDPVESGVNTVVNNPITVMMENSAGDCAAISHLLYDCVFQITPQGQFMVSK